MKHIKLFENFSNRKVYLGAFVNVDAGLHPCICDEEGKNFLEEDGEETGIGFIETEELDTVPEVLCCMFFGGSQEWLIKGISKQEAKEIYDLESKSFYSSRNGKHSEGILNQAFSLAGEDIDVESMELTENSLTLIENPKINSVYWSDAVGSKLYWQPPYSEISLEEAVQR
jgi:hypothetical protein